MSLILLMRSFGSVLYVILINGSGVGRVKYVLDVMFLILVLVLELVIVSILLICNSNNMCHFN